MVNVILILGLIAVAYLAYQYFDRKHAREQGLNPDKPEGAQIGEKGKKPKE